MNGKYFQKCANVGYPQERSGNGPAEGDPRDARRLRTLPHRDGLPLRRPRGGHGAHTPRGPVEYDDASLARIEAFYLEVLAGKLRISLSPQRLDRIITAFYGEAMRIRAGRGKWILGEGGDSLGMPVVAGWGTDAIDFTPVISREVQKSSGEPFIVNCVNYAAKRDEIHANFFDEFE